MKDSDNYRSNIGKKNENKAAEAVGYLKNRYPQIVGCYPQPRNSEFDVQGVDIVIQLNNGFAFLLQIKSQVNALQEHYKKHPYVPAIVIEKDSTTEDVAKMILAILGHYMAEFATVSPLEEFRKQVAERQRAWEEAKAKEGKPPV